MTNHVLPAGACGIYGAALIPWGLPRDASAHGPTLDHHLLLNLWIFLALLALAHLILFTGLLSRRSDAPTRLWRIEYLPLTLLTVLFAGLAIKAERLRAATRYIGADPVALQVEVTARQFVWYFRYPGSDATFGITLPQRVAPAEGNPLGLDPTDPHTPDDLVTSTLVLPVNREVDLGLKAQDVVHGFSIPEMRLKRNAIPGQTVHLHFTPTTIGTYAILCTQLCGLGHYRMNATLRILSADQFAEWLTSQKPEGSQP
jgi:cytochrome c oxidase subunit II